MRTTARTAAFIPAEGTGTGISDQAGAILALTLDPLGPGVNRGPAQKAPHMEDGPGASLRGQCQPGACHRERARGTLESRGAVGNTARSLDTRGEGCLCAVSLTQIYMEKDNFGDLRRR